MPEPRLVPTPLPARFPSLRWWHLFPMAGVLGLFMHALHGTELLDMRWQDWGNMPLNIWRLLLDTLPPSPKPLLPAAQAVLQTLHMALLGTCFGVLLSLPLGVLAARNMTPHAVLYAGARGLIALCRTVPDLVWAIYFVILVGLGPLAGALTLFVDTLGFAGRFFGEAMEEVDPGPDMALTALGATRLGRLFAYVLPAACPAFIHTTLFSFERAVQSSVVLGLVGAGGIGMLLEEPMTWHNYDEAATVVLCIFVTLAGVEQVSARLRRHMLGGVQHTGSKVYGR
jgi:phosphonate transport system permease protein